MVERMQDCIGVKRGVIPPATIEAVYGLAFALEELVPGGPGSQIFRLVRSPTSVSISAKASAICRLNITFDRYPSKTYDSGQIILEKIDTVEKVYVAIERCLLLEVHERDIS